MKRQPRSAWIASASAVAVLSLVASPAVSDLVLPSYTDSAAFAAANPGLASAGFESIAIPGGISSPGESNLIDGGATFVGETFVVDAAYAGGLPGLPFATGPYNNAGSQYLVTDAPFGTFEVDLGGPQTAFGLDVGALFLGSSDLRIEIAFDNGDFYEFDPESSFQFLGFTFASPVSGLDIVFSGMGAAEAENLIGIDNVSFGAAGAVIPAPGAALLGMIGFATLGLAKRRKDL